MAQCAGIKRDGGRCTVVVGPSQTHCYQHDPARSQERKRNASRGGRSKGNQRLAKLDKQLEDLAADTLVDKVERGVAAVVNQIINTRARLIELERKIKETEELEARLEALERDGKEGGSRWGA
jgi:septal ring factor EnvC (AmiA/AmiB activator)